MPTPNEKKALLFLGAVVLLGGTVRAWRAWAAPAPQTISSRVALDAQLQAVDSSHKSQPAKKKSGRRRAVRVDANGPLPGVPAPNFGTIHRQAVRLDLDTADSSAIDALPGIGPKLAGRIVADRATNGAFGGLDGLRTVPGLTATIVTRLDSLVTFSGPQRPLNAVLSGGARIGGNSARRGRRRTP